MLVAFVFETSAAPSFNVKSLADIHRLTKINLPDSLGICIDNDSTWSYLNKPLRVCTNRFGDVSHIGYKLFNTELLEGEKSRIVLEFIERYALEFDLQRKFSYKAIDKNQFIVKFRKGEVTMLHSITPDDGVSISKEEHHGFIVACGSGRHKVEMFIPFDCQLLRGTDAVELENVLERDINRIPFRQFPDTLPDRWKDHRMYVSDSLTYVTKGHFLNEMIRSELYLVKRNGKYHISTDKTNLTHYVSNVMQTGCAERPLPLLMTINKYAYKESVVETTLQQYLEYCQTEKCDLYLGFKEIKPDTVSVTLFAYQPDLVYNHMLSVEIPVSLLFSGEGRIVGKLYAYTPLKNISKELFINIDTPDL